MNRISTNPLEHHFGLLRIRCKFDHSFKNFVKEATKVKVLHEIERETIFNLIPSRHSKFGEVIYISNQPYGEKSIYSNKDVAYSLLSTFGFDMTKVSYKKKANHCFVENAYNQFISQLKSINCQVKKSKDILNSKDIAPSISSGAYIQQRQKNAKINSECKKKLNTYKTLKTYQTIVY